MKLSSCSLIITCVLSLFEGPRTVIAQGTFQNLNFESAQVSPSPFRNYPNPVPISSAMPDWTGYLGVTQQSQVQYNTTTLGSASISLLGPTWDASFPGIISGNYSVVLQSGLDPNNEAIQDNASIAQTGTIPASVESLQFEALVEGTFSISFAGNTLQPIILSSAVAASGEPYDIYGVNISSYAGQTGELQFTEYFDSHFPFMDLDDISFSPDAVPEPSIVALTAIGGLLFGARKWFARR
jgi:hypothetical protein